MKIPSCCLLFLFTSFFCIGQQLDSLHTESFEYYKNKAQQQKSTGLLLVGGGVVVTNIFLVLTVKNLFNEPDAKNAIGFFTGTGLIATGISFLISSSKNNRKAKTLTTGVGMQSFPSINKVSLYQTSYPAVVLKWNL